MILVKRPYLQVFRGTLDSFVLKRIIARLLIMWYVLSSGYSSFPLGHNRNNNCIKIDTKPQTTTVFLLTQISGQVTYDVV